MLHDHGRRTAWGYGLTLHVCDLLPKSRGSLTLASPDPSTPPRIKANYLSHPDDLPVLLSALKIGRRVYFRTSQVAQMFSEEGAPAA